MTTRASDAELSRRAFLGSLMAVTTVIASGVKLPASSQASRATSQALQTQSKVYALLEECYMTSLESTTVRDGLLGYECAYIHFPGKTAKRGEFDQVIQGNLKGMRPVDVRFRASAGELTTLTVWWA